MKSFLCKINTDTQCCLLRSKLNHRARGINITYVYAYNKPVTEFMRKFPIIFHTFIHSSRVHSVVIMSVLYHARVRPLPYESL